MAWDLDGVDQYFRCSAPSAVQSAAGGPRTVAFMVQLDATTDGVAWSVMSGTTVYHFIETFTSWNYGTTAGVRTGPAASGALTSWYIVIISKTSGNAAPEYTLIPWTTGPGTPVSGTITGGGATLGDGTAPGASAFYQIGRYAASATEYLNGRIAAIADFLVYKNQAAREALDSWADWLNTSGPGANLAWAMEFTALTSRVDASGNGGNETARFGTASITLAADPTNFFSSTQSEPDTSPPAAMRWRSGYETAVADGVSSDVSTPGALRWRSSLTETAQSSVVSADASAPGALRWRGSLVETGLVSVVASDTVVSGFRWRGSLVESATIGVVAADSLVTGFRWRSSLTEAGLVSLVAADTVFLGYRFRESPASGESATIGVDSLVLGMRWQSRPVDGAVIDVIGYDTQPLGWRVRDSQTAASVSVVGTDTPNGLRWRSGADGSIVNPPDGGSDVVGVDSFVLGWRWGMSLVTGYVGVPVTEEPDFYSVTMMDRFSSNVGAERFSSVVVADRL